MKSKTATKLLPVLFTKDEMLDLAKKSMETTLQIDDIENQKAKLNGLYDYVTEISKKMKSGFEDRMVVCEVKYNCPHNGKKTVIRTDTGETVEIVNMTAEEMQEDLQFTDVEIIEESKRLTGGLTLQLQTKPEEEQKS